MTRTTNRWIGCLLAFSLSGCTHAYRPHPDLDRGPTASVQLFTGANIGGVGWYPQIYDYGDRCPGLWSGGTTDGAYLGNVDLRGNHDAVQLAVRAPSNIFFQMNLVDGAGICAFFAGFRSEPGHSYRATFGTDFLHCNIEFADITGGSALPISILKVNECGPPPEPVLQKGEKTAALDR